MDVEAIRAELKDVRDKIKSLKSSFNSKRDSKEEFFAKGEQYSEEINKLYEDVKAIEKEHNLDKINEELDAKKAIYDELKVKVAEAEKKFDSVKGNFKKVERPAVKTVSVEKAKQELKQLDLKLQTQVLSLDKESEVTRKIAELKEIVGQHKGGVDEVESTEGSGDNLEFKSVRKEYSTLKRKFVNVERKIRSLYKQIRLISKDKKAKYKRIDELRNLRKESFDLFKNEKKEYSVHGKDLKDLFTKEEELLEKLGEEVPQRKRKFNSNSSNERELKKKQKEVEDNFLNNGGKLTTEDLLMFQRKK